MAAQVSGFAEGEVEARGLAIGPGRPFHGFGHDAVPGPLPGQDVVFQALFVGPAAAEQHRCYCQDGHGPVGGLPVAEDPAISPDLGLGEGNHGHGGQCRDPRPDRHLDMHFVVMQAVEKPSQRIGKQCPGHQRAKQRQQENRAAEDLVPFPDGQDGGKGD